MTTVFFLSFVLFLFVNSYQTYDYRKSKSVKHLNEKMHIDAISTVICSHGFSGTLSFRSIYSYLLAFIKWELDNVLPKVQALVKTATKDRLSVIYFKTSKIKTSKIYYSKFKVNFDKTETLNNANVFQKKRKPL